MILIKVGGVFKTENFDNIIYNAKAEEITGYTVESPVSLVGFVKDRFTLTVVAHSLNKGDVILVKGDDDIEDDFVIVGVGTNTIKVASLLNLNINTAVEVRTQEYIINMGSIVEGQYHLPTNEVIIIANTFSNLYVNKASIKSRFNNLDDNTDIDLLNTEAKESIIADFSFNPYFYKNLDLGQLTELQKRKMLCILEMGFLSESEKYCRSYDALVKTVTSYLNTKDKNKPNLDVTTDDLLENSGGIDIGWGS